MRETTTNVFRQYLKSEVDQCIANHEILRVTRRNGKNFIVISETDWRAIEETSYLNQFPGLVSSIHEAAQEPLEQGTPYVSVFLHAQRYSQPGCLYYGDFWQLTFIDLSP